MKIRWLSLLAAVSLTIAPTPAFAWSALGHRTIAAIAMQLLPPEKVAHINQVLAQLEIDNNDIDAASYPDEYIRNHDPGHKFNSWHFADLMDDPSAFVCGECLFKALPQNLALVRNGPDNKGKAVALAWVIHLVGDLHQPLHMIDRDRGGNNFQVTYRGRATCPSYTGGRTKVELHSVWDDCLVEELAAGRDAQTLATDLLGGITTYVGRPETLPAGPTPWLTWGNESHALAESVAFDSLRDGDDLEDPYIVGSGKALDVAKHQLLVAGIRLAMLLDQNF